MKNLIIILLVAITATSCKKTPIPNINKTTSMVEFDFNGKHYSQKVNKDGSEESGNKGTYNSSASMSGVQSNDGNNWAINLGTSDAGTNKSITLTFGVNGTAGYEAWGNVVGSMTPATIKIDRSKGTMSGTFSAILYKGAVQKELTNGKITEVPFTVL